MSLNLTQLALSETWCWKKWQLKENMVMLVGGSIQPCWLAQSSCQWFAMILLLVEGASAWGRWCLVETAQQESAPLNSHCQTSCGAMSQGSPWQSDFIFCMEFAAILMCLYAFQHMTALIFPWYISVINLKAHTDAIHMAPWGRIKKKKRISWLCERV